MQHLLFPTGTIHDAAGNRIAGGVERLVVEFTDEHGWGEAPAGAENGPYWDRMARPLLEAMRGTLPGGLFAALGIGRSETLDASGRVKPLPGIPAEVACPFCGGYVRGHQWIGADNCSTTTTSA